MDAQRRAEITGWDAREFSDGFADLRRLVDRRFSGAVTDGAGWLFLFEGRVVGTVDAELDAFSDASGTIYKAPHESLPVLFAMQERGGEPRAQYYTNDTPLSEADGKLSRGGFTGYIELSENVLSGDYYVTYTAGESMAAAFVGNSRRLETGDAAFDLADDEVGIYTVYEVDLNVREIPADEGTSSVGTTGGVTAGAESTDGTTTGGATTGGATTGGATTGGATTGGATTGEEAGDTDEVGAAGDADVSGAHRASGTDATPATDEDLDAADDAIEMDPEPDASGVGDNPPATPVDTENGAADRETTPSPSIDPDESSSSDVDGVNGRGTPGETTGSAGRTGSNEPNGSTEAEDDEPAVASRATGSSATRPGDADDSATGPADEDVFSEEEQWREQKSIPALDPSRASAPPENTERSAKARSGQRSRDGRQSGDTDRSAETDAAASEGADRTPEPRSTEGTTSDGSAVSQRSTETANGSDARKRIQELQTALEAAENERESLAAEVDDVKAERDDVAAERDELAAEVDRLETEISTLREERDRFREELSAARERLPDTERSISAREARSGTNLFVRYDSKGGATLEDAHEGSVDRDELRENLRIEHHTSFETDGLSVDGRPFKEFLKGTIEYGFTRWIVEDLPFEVSETGNQSVLRDLYDAIPEIDRAEIGGSVSIAIRENGEETREQRAFDLVLRDRMGNPLFVADLNDSRDPTAEGALESLVGNGRDIAESNDSFAAAFAVTESFFEPGALETASGAVGGGLFSRSKRASFVKLSRKQGYHLCLVEARDGGFHMTVPDL